MDLRQLEHFIAAAEERHFTRAARRMHIVQSGLSASIRALEMELGTPLFVRSTRHVEMTEAGRVLLAEGRRVLAAVAAAKQAVAAVQGLARGTLALGTMQSLPPRLALGGLLNRFHAAHPGVEIRLRQAGSAVLVEEVRSGRLDLAFVGLSGPAPEGISATILGREPLVVACAPTHPLACQEAVRLTDLQDEVFVDFDSDWSTRVLVDRAFSSSQLERRTVFEVSDVPTLLDLVAHGLGITVLPQATAESCEAVRCVPLCEPHFTWDLAVATVGDPPASPAAQALLAMLALPAEPLLAEWWAI